MYDICYLIASQKNYDNSLTDGFGETFGNLLLYKRISDNSKRLTDLVLSYIDNENMDINVPNNCNETMLQIAVEHVANNDIVEKLLSLPRVNPNIVNEFGSSALTNAIRANNIDAVKMLLNRKDTVVRQEDYSVASNVGFDLDKMVKVRKDDNSKENEDIVQILKNIIAEKLNI